MLFRTRISLAGGAVTLPRTSSFGRSSRFAATATTTAPHLYSARRFNVQSSGVPMQMPSQWQVDFKQYEELDLPSSSRVDSIRNAGLAGKNHVWVAQEKVHGTNFSCYLLDEINVRYAKRTGIMDHREHFFGYHLLADDFTRWITTALQLLKKKYNLPIIKRVIFNGELFGAKYEHPKVPASTRKGRTPGGINFSVAKLVIQEEEFPQYSPELHWCAFDLRYSVSGKDSELVQIPYDDFAEICSQIDGLLWAKALVRGTLDECLTFDVENFETPLPAQLGLGNYPLKRNYAEGVVVRHVLRGSPAVENKGVSTMLKIRCSAFMELKHAGKQQELKAEFFDAVRAAAIQRVGGEAATLSEALLPQIEAQANKLLLNNVSAGRLNNVVSKVGREVLRTGEVTKEKLALLLAKDSVKDFLKELDEKETAVLNTPVAFRKTLLTNCYAEALNVVTAEWQRFTADGDGAGDGGADEDEA